MNIQQYELAQVLTGAILGGSIGFFFIMRVKRLAQLTFDRLNEEMQNVRERLVLSEDKAQRYETMTEEKNQLFERLSDARAKYAEVDVLLGQERKQFQEKLKVIEEARQELSNAFQALSAQALERNNRSFLDLAKSTLEKFHETAKGDLQLKEKAISELVSPIRESLHNVDQKIGEIEKIRLSTYEVLRHQVGDLILSQKELRSETANLVKALRTPHVRGRWGEMQLRRVVEMSGMSVHCDFIEQTTLEGEEIKLRPDMIVRLPGDKRLIIDAKAPLAAYLDALEAKEETLCQNFLKDHARQVRTHILSLSTRAYWDQLSKSGETPEFVVMFLPGETIFSAALEQDPSLIEVGVEKQVILATPATLIALLHAVAYGWRQERLADNAREISQLGRELYKRLSDMGSHLAKLGQSLGGSVRAYNSTIASLESRVLPSARRFKELNASSSQDEIALLPQLDHLPRDLQSPELHLVKETG
jgi:DNA recombination protein RmuC